MAVTRIGAEANDEADHQSADDQQAKDADKALVSHSGFGLGSGAGFAPSVAILPASLTAAPAV
jgi:hypothetical protein